MLDNPQAGEWKAASPFGSSIPKYIVDRNDFKEVLETCLDSPLGVALGISGEVSILKTKMLNMPKG